MKVLLITLTTILVLISSWIWIWHSGYYIMTTVDIIDIKSSRTGWMPHCQDVNYNQQKLLDLQKAWDRVPFNNASNMPRALNESQHVQLIGLLDLVDHIFRKYNISYSLYFGSLLGSYLSHSILPWDDDLDIVMDAKDLLKLHRIHDQRILKNEMGLNLLIQCFKWPYKVPPKTRGQVFKVCKNIKLKIYNGVHEGISNVTSWRWPFVDILTFDSNVSHVWINNYPKPIVIKYDEFFPFHRRPFSGLWLPAPSSPKEALGRYYKSSDSLQ